MGFWSDWYEGGDAQLGGILPGGVSTKDVTFTDALKANAVAPLSGLFAIGAGVNDLTGGDSTTYSAQQAIIGLNNDPTFSKFTQAASGYQSDRLGGGEWRLPVLNPAGGEVTGDAIASVSEYAGQTAGGIAGGLFKGLGVGWSLALVAAGGVALAVAVR